MGYWLLTAQSAEAGISSAGDTAPDQSSAGESAKAVESQELAGVVVSEMTGDSSNHTQEERNSATSSGGNIADNPELRKILKTRRVVRILLSLVIRS